MARHVLPDGLIIEGHVLDALASLPAESVQMAVTSPPYFGLRSYSNDQRTVWGGDKDCDHEFGNEKLVEEKMPPAKRRCKNCRKFGVCSWDDVNTVRVWCHRCQLETVYDDVPRGQGKAVEGKKWWIDEAKGNGTQKHGNASHGATCLHCGAWYGAYGLEDSPARV